MIASVGARTFFGSILGAALLEPQTYEEASLLPAVRLQAVLIVALSALAAGIGSLGGGVMGFAVGALSAALGWAFLAGGAYWTATRKFAVPASPTTWGATWRTLALASAPRIFLILTFLPAIGFLIGLAVLVWALIAAVFALRIALDLEGKPTVAIAVCGWLPMAVLWVITAAVL